MSDLGGYVNEGNCKGAEVFEFWMNSYSSYGKESTMYSSQAIHFVKLEDYKNLKKEINHLKQNGKFTMSPQAIMYEEQLIEAAGFIRNLLEVVKNVNPVMRLHLEFEAEKFLKKLPIEEGGKK